MKTPTVTIISNLNPHPDRAPSARYPLDHCVDWRFRYTPAAQTDIKKTFARIKAIQQTKGQ